MELVTSAEIVGPGRALPGRDEPLPNVLYGYTTIGSCTLMGVLERGSSRHYTEESGQVVLTRSFRVGLCVIGLHISAYSAGELTSATCNYAGLGDWLQTSTTIDVTDDGLLIRHPRRAPPILDFCVAANKTRITLRVVHDMTFTPSKRHSASNDKPQISIEPIEPASVEQLYNAARRVENFFSLCIGTSVVLRTVHLEDWNGKEGWLVYPRLRKIEKPDIFAHVRCSASDLAGAMATWFTTYAKLRPLEDLIFGTIRNTSMFVETEFLSLAQALESFHRVTDSGTLAEPIVFKRALKALLTTIDSSCADKALAKRLADAVRYANEPSFNNRIESMLARLSHQHVVDLLDDPAVFGQTLRQTRNFFTHPGIKRGKRVLTNTKDIFLFNQKLHALLRLLILINVGFAEESVFELVKHQSRKWRLL